MRLLNSHPEVLCLGEGRFFGREWRRPEMKERSATKQPSSLHNALSDSEYLRAWIERSVWSRDDVPEKHVNNLARLAIDYFLAQKLAGTGKRIVGDKTPLLAKGVVKEIHDLYPEAKVIHIVRDGRDRAVSLMNYLWNTAREGESGVFDLSPNELEKRDAYRRDPRRFAESGEGIFTEERLRRMASQWNDRVGENAKDGRSLFGESYAEGGYEDLLERPEDEARRLLEFLGAKADGKTVGRCVEAASFERLSKGRDKGEEDHASMAARKGVAGDWRNVFTEKDRLLFEEIAGEALTRTGYEKDGES